MIARYLLSVALGTLMFSTGGLAETPDDNSQAAPPSSESTVQPDASVEELTPPAPLPLPLDALRKFADVFGKIKQDYVEEIDDETLLNYAIRGMLSDLDPHSAYLEPSAFTSLKENTTGSFGGLGIEVGMENGFVKVIAPIDDTPAAKGGVEAGDLIIQLDDTPVKGMSLNKAVEMMRGEAGTPIELTILRAKAREPIKIKLTRDVIQVTSVKTLNLDDSYGYIRITQFQAETGKDFEDGLNKLKEKSSKLTGLIIDLRNNPGGVLQASVEVADQLLDDGLIVYTEGRSAVAELSYSATPGDSTDGMPIVVLIDGGSASASEILAGALQDHDRAVIMGTRSFGKGSVQNVVTLGEEYALKLTTARYFTPNGRSIQAQGIEPDIEVNRAKLGDEKQQNTYREADLAGHLSNGNGNSDSDLDSEEYLDAEEARRRDILKQDFQLQEALNLLKAIDILQIKYDKKQG